VREHTGLVHHESGKDVSHCVLYVAEAMQGIVTRTPIVGKPDSFASDSLAVADEPV
jgi:hypothetical protein